MFDIRLPRDYVTLDWQSNTSTKPSKRTAGGPIIHPDNPFAHQLFTEEFFHLDISQRNRDYYRLSLGSSLSPCLVSRPSLDILHSAASAAMGRPYSTFRSLADFSPNSTEEPKPLVRGK